MRDSTRMDGWLLGAVVLLSLFGLVMLYSSSVIFAEQELGSKTALLRSQLAKLLIGWVLLSVLCRMQYRRLNGTAAWVLIALTGGAMALAILPGLFPAINKTNRFVSILGLRGQPVEFARLALVVFLAHWVSENEHWQENRWRGLLYPLGAIGGVAILAKLQPHLSSAILIVCLGVGMLFAAGQSVRRLAAVLIPMIVAVLISLKDYQRERIADYVRSLVSGGPVHYQVEQSLIALGSGGLSGKGVGQGLQKFMYLPYPHSDFLLGIIGEETGFLGVFILFVLYVVVVARGFRIARLAPDRFGQTLAFGLTFSIALNFLLHSVVVMGWGPVTGVPLPFASHGGSSLLANLIAMGLLLAISRSARPEPEAIRPAWRWMGSPQRAE